VTQSQKKRKRAREREREKRERKEKKRKRIIYLIYCKNLCNCHNVPSPITTIKEKRER
jgi:hypothetical protein